MQGPAWSFFSWPVCPGALRPSFSLTDASLDAQDCKEKLVGLNRGRNPRKFSREGSKGEVTKQGYGTPSLPYVTLPGPQTL